MFSGQHEQKLDDKGRLRLPAKYRSELGKSFAIMKGIDNTLSICSKEEYDDICKRLLAYDKTNIVVQRAISEYMSNIEQIEEDAQGRFIIPQRLKAYAGIEKNVVIKGVLDRIEIWSLANHEDLSSNLSMNEILGILHDANQQKVAQNG